MYTDLLDKGYASLRRGDPDAALIRFRHAAESEPERPQAYFGMAMVYLEQDSNDETVNALEQARQKSKSMVMRELPDPRRWMRLFARFMPRKSDETSASGKVELH